MWVMLRICTAKCIDRKMQYTRRYLHGLNQKIERSLCCVLQIFDVQYKNLFTTRQIDINKFSKIRLKHNIYHKQTYYVYFICD